MGFLSLFLVLLILIQRGKGGGLAGALGGPGGQSAFGSKAGDTFTWITVAVATVWGITCALAMLTMGDSGASAFKTPATMEAGVDDTTAETGPISGEGLDLSGLGMGEAPSSDGADSEPATEGLTTEGSTTESPVAEGNAGSSMEAAETTTPETTTPGTEADSPSPESSEIKP